MKKRNKIVLAIAVIMVVALCVGLFVGCSSKGKTIISSGKAGSGTVVTVEDVDCLQSFAVKTANDMSEDNFKKYFTAIEYVTGKTVEVNVGKRGVNEFVINAPTDGYKMMTSYKIALRSGANFANYPKADAIAFTVTKNLLSKSKLNDGVKEYNILSVVKQSSAELGAEVTDGYKYGVGLDDNNVEYGQFQMNTQGVMTFADGEVFIVNDSHSLKKEAYKVVDSKSVGADVVEVSYTKPLMGEVYEDFQYADEGKNLNAAEGTVEWVDDATVNEGLEKSVLAKDILSIFGEKPTFNFAPSIVTDSNGNSVVRVVVSITVPGVVRTANGCVNLSIIIQNDLLVTSKTVVNLTEMFNDIKEANFSLNTTIKNDTTCKVVIDVSGGYTIIQNAQELLDKLTNLSGGEEADDAIYGDEANQDAAETSVCVPIFRWTLPLAAGAFGISYNADLAFRFSFSGQFELAIKGSIEYDVDVRYTKADGVKITSENVKEEDKWLDSIDMSLQGCATVKVGVIQSIGINILAGVLNVEVSAEIGNYNRLYGYAKTSNLLIKDFDVVGAMYFEGGFYYELNLVFAIRLGFLTIGDTNVYLTGGEIRMYEAGNQELELCLDEMPNYTTKAYTNALPEYTVSVYNLVSRGVEHRALAPNQVQYSILPETIVVGTGDEAVADENAIAINKDGVLSVAVANRNQHVACTVEVIYKNAKGHTFPSVLTKVVYDGRLLSLEQQDFSFDKASRDSIVMNIAIEDGLAQPKVYDATNYDAKKPEASLKEIPSVYDAVNKTITINNKDVCSLKTGANKLFVKSGDIIAPLNIVTVGKVSLSKDVIGNNYDIYTPDQIVEMMGLSGNDTTDKTFNITRDIDMGGIVIPSLAELGARGVINGNGHTISRYTINNVIGNNAGFVAVNRGTIKDLTLIGNVDVSVPAQSNLQQTLAV